MSEQLPFLVPPYNGLAGVYDQAGFSDFARQHVPRYIRFAQSMDWAGRRVLDLGCGTGVSTWWLSQQGFRVLGIDNNPDMLAQAEAQEQALAGDATMIYDAPTFMNMDIRALESPTGEVDMVLAAGNVINAIQSLRDIENIFARVHQVLAEGKLFIFDVYTIQGLAENLSQRDEIAYDNGHDLVVVTRNRFNYETLGVNRHFTIFQHDGASWVRKDEIHYERGYPTQAIAALLERTGFQIVTILTPHMEPYDAHALHHERVVFFAQK